MVRSQALPQRLVSPPAATRIIIDAASQCLFALFAAPAAGKHGGQDCERPESNNVFGGHAPNNDANDHNDEQCKSDR